MHGLVKLIEKHFLCIQSIECVNVRLSLNADNSVRHLVCIEQQTRSFYRSKLTQYRYGHGRIHGLNCGGR